MSLDATTLLPISNKCPDSSSNMISELQVPVHIHVMSFSLFPISPFFLFRIMNHCSLHYLHTVSRLVTRFRTFYFGISLLPSPVLTYVLFCLCCFSIYGQFTYHLEPKLIITANTESLLTRIQPESYPRRLKLKIATVPNRRSSFIRTLGRLLQLCDIEQ